MKLRELFKRPFNLDFFALFLPTAAMMALLAMSPLRSWDYWWHLTIGRLVDYWGRVPGANHFSYVLDAETVVFHQPWGAQWMLFVIHDIGGIELAMFSRTLLAASALLGITWISARKTGSIPRAALAALIAVPVLAFTIDLGPLVFVLPLWTLLIGFRLRVQTQRRQYWLLLLFPLGAALWANLATLFIAPALALIHRPKGLDRHSGLVLGAAIASAFTPMMHPGGGEVYADLFARALALDPALAGALAALGAIYAIPLIAGVLPTGFDGLLAKSPRPSLCLVLTLVVVVGSLAIQPIYPAQGEVVKALSPIATRADTPLAGRVLPEVPVVCTERFYRMGKQLRIFHPPKHAGYLLHRLQTPRPAPMVLNIPTMFARDEPLLDLYELGTNAGVARALMHQHDVNAVIAEHATHGEIIAFLEADPGWYVLIENDDHSCFVRR